MKFNNTGVRVLVDPWLEGDLTFFNQDWLYKGKKRVLNTAKGGKIDIKEIIDETDVVVLTQWLDDHLHVPTLKKIPRDTLIVANAEAAEAIKPMGFTNIQLIDHGQTLAVANGRLSITASAGALVGPPWSKRQNGYAFRERSSTDGASASLYFEPHCDFVDSSVAKLGKVDVVVSPVVSTLLGSQAASYPLVMGDINLMRLLKLLQPRVLVPLLNSEIDSEGPLSEVVYDRGSIDQVKQQLKDSKLATRLELPAPPGESLAIAL